MACSAHCCGCKETQYTARNISVVSAVPHPNSAPCNSAANKAAAERNAMSDLQKLIIDSGEKVDTCKDDEECVCDEFPPWPADVTHGWREVNKNLKLAIDVTIGGLDIVCRWTVTVKYDRYYRARSADCIKKPPV